MDYPKFIVSNQKEQSISLQMVNKMPMDLRDTYYKFRIDLILSQKDSIDG